MSKKIISVIMSIMIILATFTCTGCLGQKTILGSSISDTCYVNASYEVEYSENDFNKLMNNINKMQVACANQSKGLLGMRLLATTTSINLYKLIDALSLARLYYYSDMSDYTNYNAFCDISDKYSTAINEFKKLYKLFADSKYKEIFYGDLSDEEIQELVDKAISSDELINLDNEVVDIQTQFHNLDGDEIKTEKFDNLFSQLINANNSIAKINGYDNYLDYSYADIYGRDFTPQDTLLYTTSLKDNLLPTVYTVKNNIDLIGSKLGKTKIDEAQSILDDDFLSSQSQKILTAFYKSLGSEIYNAYNTFINNGYYYISQSKDAYQGAFTSYFQLRNKPFIYFGPGYTSVSTFVHEFGHYLNYYLCGALNDTAFELAETHSQGAEWLFISFLNNYFEDQDQYNYLVNDYFYSNGYMTFVTALVGAFEVRAYTDSVAMDLDFNGIMTNLVTETFGEAGVPTFYRNYIQPEEYYRYVVIDNPGYYISYSVSLISSLEIFAKSYESYSDGVDCYVSILNCSENYVQSLEDNGLISPFEDGAFELIYDAFVNIN